MIQLIFGAAEYDRPTVYEAEFIPAPRCEMEMSHSRVYAAAAAGSLIKKPGACPDLGRIPLGTILFITTLMV